MTIRAEFVRFFILAALFFGALLGIPFLYRMLTSVGYSQTLHPDKAYTGQWVGVLQAPTVKANIQRDPYESEAAYQLEVRSAAQQEVAHIHATRAIYLDLGLDAFKVGNPRLRGKIRMCAYNGAVADFSFTTISMTDTGAELVLTTDKSDEFGNLTLRLADAKLQTSYDAQGSKLNGTLARGSLNEFEQACGRVAAGAKADLNRASAVTAQ